MLDFIKATFEIFTVVSLWLFAVKTIINIEKNDYYNIFNISLLFMILSANVYSIVRIALTWVN